MIKGFYAKLAFQNLNKNRKIYLPYILTSVITVAMFYVITSLSHNGGVQSMHGGQYVIYLLGYGTVIVGIFAVIFLFYTHSFIIKRRQKEFGLYNILGLEKRHLGVVLAFENSYIAVISVVLGILVGIILDKMMFLILAKILNSAFGMGFFISWKAILITFLLFTAIFAAIYLYAFLRVCISKPIELLKGDNAGEKEPKTKLALAITGLLALITGYVCAISTKNGISAIELFFIAVILVIIGTYFLFTAGSIALLKALKKNKKYYYKTNRFIGVSGMTYRMKQNAVGLASICILATMLLVTVSTTASFMAGKNDMLNARYPYDLMLRSKYGDGVNAEIVDGVRELIRIDGLSAEREIGCKYLSFTVARDGKKFKGFDSDRLVTSNPCVLIIVTADVYGALTGKNAELGDDEILISLRGIDFDYSEMEILGREFAVKDEVGGFIREGLLTGDIPDAVGGVYVVVQSDEALNEISALQKELYGDKSSAATFIYAVDFSDGANSQIAFYQKLQEMLTDKNYNADLTSKAAASENFMSLYGGLFFLGCYLGTLFLMATILIIYYKQISEGYEDKKRFDIMLKVGMSYDEVKKAIRYQILAVFFLPLITAGVHVAFAFPMINQMLSVFYLTNMKLFALCTLGCFGVFAIIYVAVYMLTARTYYGLVRSASDR